MTVAGTQNQIPRNRARTQGFPVPQPPIS